MPMYVVFNTVTGEGLREVEVSADVALAQAGAGEGVLALASTFDFATQYVGPKTGGGWETKTRPTHLSLPSGSFARNSTVTGFPASWPVKVYDPLGAIAYDGLTPADGGLRFSFRGSWRVDIIEDWSEGPQRPATVALEIT